VKRHLLFPLFILFTACANLPDAKEGLKIEKSYSKIQLDNGESASVRKAWAYKQEEKEVHTKSVLEVLSNDERTKLELTRAKRFYYFHESCNWLSALTFMYGLAQSNETRMSYMLGSFLIAGLGHATRSIGTSELDRAVDIYNQGPPAQTLFEILPASQNENIGIVLDYRF